MTRRKATAGVKDRDAAAPAPADTALGEGPPEPAGLIEDAGSGDPFDLLDEAANDELNELLLGLAYSRRAHSPRHRVLD